MQCRILWLDPSLVLLEREVGSCSSARPFTPPCIFCSRLCSLRPKWSLPSWVWGNPSSKSSSFPPLESLVKQKRGKARDWNVFSFPPSFEKCGWKSKQPLHLGIQLGPVVFASHCWFVPWPGKLCWRGTLFLCTWHWLCPWGDSPQSRGSSWYHAADGPERQAKHQPQQWERTKENSETKWWDNYQRTMMIIQVKRRRKALTRFSFVYLCIDKVDSPEDQPLLCHSQISLSIKWVKTLGVCQYFLGLLVHFKSCCFSWMYLVKLKASSLLPKYVRLARSWIPKGTCLNSRLFSWFSSGKFSRICGKERKSKTVKQLHHHAKFLQLTK